MKDFIPFEESLALKRLGFDEDCYSYFREDMSQGPIGLYYTYDHPQDLNVLQPTFSQAFRWFRENHLLVVSQDRDGGWWIFNIKTVEDEDNEGCKKVKDGHIIRDEYEEAELECLKRLIEIVKQNR
jgi:hypothetical protein